MWDAEESRQRDNNVQRSASGTIQIVYEGQTFSVPMNTTPEDVAAIVGVSQDQHVAAAVDDLPWDLHRPLFADCSLQYFDFDHVKGKDVFWHSSAHILGQAVELYYLSQGLQVFLRDGPSLGAPPGGFFYDMQIRGADNAPVNVSGNDFSSITSIADDIIKAKQPFQRLEVSREFARDLFDYNPLKRALIDKVPEGEALTLYRCGPLIDLCRGPHLSHTGLVKAFAVTKNAGNVQKSTNAGVGEQTLQRVYGISFPEKVRMKEWKQQQALAAKNDHRVLGPAQELFMFHPLSPGSAFMLPHGTRIYNRLVEHMREHYRRIGFEEVITPLLYHKTLWETSGHWQNYKEDMYTVQEGVGEEELEKNKNQGGCCGGDARVDASDAPVPETMGLKPMNCPGHCLIFASQTRSYRQLPIRYADFSPLHRNEASGSLTGLTRVRRFNQDDGHIFCSEEQVRGEIQSCLELLREVYSVFGFSFAVKLSTRPEKYMGDLGVWERAEDALKEALEAWGEGYRVEEGDGAFYGPKIDIVLTDAFGRHHQCGTIQLDFQLPLRFGLEYKGADGQLHRPVMIHRAVLGSLERMLAILCEHFEGKWPLWLSPRQVVVCPIADRHVEYAERVGQRLREAGFYAEINDGRGTIQKQIRQAQKSNFNYILVVGDEEMAQETVNVRTRDGAVHGGSSMDELLQTLRSDMREFR